MKRTAKEAREFMRGITAALPNVQPLFSKVTLQAKKERAAVITTTVEPTQAEKSDLERLLVRLLGHDVACRYKIDSQLLGGMTVQVADWVVDSSLKTQLTILSTSLQSI